MKKNYTNPVVEITAFDIEDIVMASAIDGSKLTSGSAGYTNFSDSLNAANNAGGTKGVIVEW